MSSRVQGAQAAGPLASIPADADSVRQLLDRATAIRDEELASVNVRVADWIVRLRFTDAQAASLYCTRLGGPLDDSRASRVDLTFNLLETRALGWPAPSPQRRWYRSPRQFEEMLKSLGLRGAFPAAETPAPADPFSIFDPAARIGLQLVDSLSELPPWDRGAPFRILVNLAAASRGCRLVHAATLSMRGKGILIVGAGGAGKSGTCLAGLAGGLHTVGDDYVLIAPGEPLTAFRVYRLLKQDREGLARIPGLAARTGHEQVNWQNKLELDPELLFPGCMVEEMRLSAIVMPVIARAPQTQFVPADTQTAFQQFAPSMWAQMPGARASGFMFAAWLTRQLPVFRMLLSENSSEIAGSVSRFIEEVPA
jgi:hypothetical protein